jgi:hypothetical protein
LVKRGNKERRKPRNGRRVPPKTEKTEVERARLRSVANERRRPFPGTPFIIPFFARKNNEKNAERNFRRFFLKISPIFSDSKSFWGVFRKERRAEETVICFRLNFGGRKPAASFRTVERWSGAAGVGTIRRRR